MEERYDIAIIGSGPAGISAAINATIRNKKIIIFGISELSHKLIKAPRIDNYLGFYAIKGKELKKKFQEHLDRMNIKINYERVNAVYAMGDYFSMAVNDKMYEAKTIIIATGMEYAKPIKGEEEFLGRGVGYCATCDAPLYRGKIVTIIGYNSDAEKEANFVSEIAGKLYYVPLYKASYNVNDKIQIINDSPQEIVGNDRVTKLVLKNQEISTDAVFVLKDSISPAQLVPGLDMDGEHIFVDRTMRTSIEGCYAAGDCTGKPYQYMKSVGEGQTAALNAAAYLDSNVIS